MKRVISFLLTCVILLVPLTTFAAFSDVPSGHWAEAFITELTQQGVINGFTDGTYGPDQTLTYGQFLKLIITATESNIDYDLIKTNFDHWAAGYLKVAENYGAVDANTVTKEMLDAPISRIDVIKIMGICDINVREHVQGSANLEFTDISDLTSMQRILLSHAVAKGIIGGYPDGTFKPQNNLTRAEAAKILSVYMNLK